MRELKAAGLQHFQDGDMGSINPNLPFSVQADLLPYDRKYEFPIEQLTLGDVLGSGAFGIVRKAIAKKILSHEDETTVAVKMVKQNYDNEVGSLFLTLNSLQKMVGSSNKSFCVIPMKVMRALVMELKIMIHLRHHDNILNLLGAVTENRHKRKQN